MSDLVLVATDGGRMATSALKFAATYAAAEGAAVEIITVVEPLRDLPGTLPHRDELEHARARGVAQVVRERLRQLIGPAGWPVHVRLGRPAPAICQAAEARRASMVVLGMDGRAGDGNSTAVEVVHLSRIPVYVARDAWAPRTAVVGIDFGPSSVRVARHALRLVGPEGLLQLVHVEPSLDFPAASVWGWGGCHAAAVSQGFTKLIADLEALGAKDVRTLSRVGDPAIELLRAAEASNTDLLAIGSDGYIHGGRAIVGRVARRVLADPPLSLLVIPGLTTSEATVVEVPDVRSLPQPVTT